MESRRRLRSPLPDGLPRAWSYTIYIATAAYLISAPFSVATALDDAMLFKWVRTFATILGCGAVVFFLPYPLGKEFKAFLGFILLYIAGALWSEAPEAGLLYKGLLIPTFLLAWGLAAIERAGAKQGSPWLTFRFITIVGCFITGLMLYQVYMHPDIAISRSNRLSSYGINANSIAQSVAPIAVVSLLGFRHDASRFRAFHGLSSVLAGMALIATGSRAGLGIVIVGFAINLILTKRITTGIVAALILVTAVLMWWSYSPIAEGASRLWEIDLRTRLPRWQVEVERFKESPLMGHGWIFDTGRRFPTTQTVLNAYLQIAVELGVVGLVAFAFSQIRILSTVIGRVAEEKQANIVSIRVLALSLYGAMMAHGFAEAAIFLPSSLPSFFWAFAVALCSIDSSKKAPQIKTSSH